LARRGQHLRTHVLDRDIPVVGIDDRIGAHGSRYIVTVVDAAHHDRVTELGSVVSWLLVGGQGRGFGIGHQPLCHSRQCGFALPLDENAEHANQAQDHYTCPAGAMCTPLPRAV
jgi:hypothetical protein